MSLPSGHLGKIVVDIDWLMCMCYSCRLHLIKWWKKKDEKSAQLLLMPVFAGALYTEKVSVLFSSKYHLSVLENPYTKYFVSETVLVSQLLF